MSCLLQVYKLLITNIEPKTTQELKEMLKNKPEKFAPWTREILKWYFHQPSSIQPIK